MNRILNITKYIIAIIGLMLSQSIFAQYDYYVRPEDHHPQPTAFAAPQKTSEYSYKLYTGLNLSRIGFREEKGEIDPDVHVRPGLDLGIRIDHYFYKNMTYYRSIGFRYSYGSYKVDFPEGDIKATQHRVIVPFTIGLLGQINDTYVGFGPNIHLGASIGGTSHLDYQGVKDTYSCNGDESSFVCGLGVELWFEHRNVFYSVSYNKSLEWYQMPEEFGDWESHNRGMFALNVGFCF